MVYRLFYYAKVAFVFESEGLLLPLLSTTVIAFTTLCTFAAMAWFPRVDYVRSGRSYRRV